MVINDRDFEIKIRNKIEIIKKEGYEIDFKLALLRDLYERIMTYPKINCNDISYFEKTIFKGFIYSTLTIDDMDYLTIMTASDSLNNPHTVFFVPCLLLNIIKVYGKDEGMSKGPDFSLNVDEENKQKFKTIDEWVEYRLQLNSYRMSFKLRYHSRIEARFFWNKVFEYFGYRNEIVIDGDYPNAIVVDRVFSTYQGFLKFLFSSPLIYKNIEIVDPFLKKHLKKDFGEIINNFDKEEKIMVLGEQKYKF